MKIVDKTLDILEAILRHGGEVSLSDLSDATGLHVSNIRRFTGTLVKRGYLYQKQRGGNYSFGLKFLQFSNITRVTNNIEDIAFPFLKQLCEEISHAVALTILDGLTTSDITIVNPPTLRIVPNALSGQPLHCTAAGKIFLAYMSDEKLDHIVNTMKLKAYTRNTIVDWNKLKIEIENVRHDDVAYDTEEFISGVVGIATPIKNSIGEVLATFTIVSPKSTLTNNMSVEDLVSKMRSFALEASHAFGYKD